MIDPRPVVCHLLHSMSVGGAEILAKEFAERSNEVVNTVFACLDGLGDLGKELRSRGYIVDVLGRRPGVDLNLIPKLRDFWRRNRVQLVHAHQYTPFFYAAVARFPGKWPPIIFTEHGRHYPDVRKWKRVVANKLLFRSSDRIVAVGNQVKLALISNEGLRAEHIDVVHNGVDLKRFGETKSNRTTIRESFDVRPDEFVIIQVARLNRLKDHLTAVRAISQVVASIPKTKLWIVGEGEERASIEREISLLGLESSIRLLGCCSDIPSLLQASDAFLLTSVSEGIPLTLIEAMASGIACVSTNVGGVSEVIVDGTSGLLAKPSDPNSIAQHIISIIENPQLRAGMAGEGKKRAHAYFSNQSMHAWYCEKYLTMAKLYSPPTS